MKYLTRFNEAREDKKYYTNLFINSYKDPKIQEMIPSNMINWDFHDKDGHDIGMQIEYPELYPYVSFQYKESRYHLGDYRIIEAVIVMYKKSSIRK